jgi:formamidopyrimidine-DNA glycosylase
VRAVHRRGKYLLVDCGDGHLILHLGMSGSLRMLPPGTPAEKHDHFDLVLGDRLLRLRDPRRFGAVLWTSGAVHAHPLIANLGLEPLSRALHPARLHALTRGHRTAIKLFLMDGRRVVGVGNIYASESLFRAGIDPRMRANRLTLAQATRLSKAIKDTLRAAIRAGGSSLRDYVGATGERGEAQSRHWVYEREGKPCRRCGTPIKRIVQGQRSTYFCPRCQKLG